MKTVPLSDLIQETGSSRQLLMYHLKSLQEEYPETELYFREGRSNYLTEEGVRLLKEKLWHVQNAKRNENKKESLKKAKGESDEFALLEELMRQVSLQQDTFNKTLDRLHEESLQKNKQIESLHQILLEQQRIIENQQQLSLLDKKEVLSLPIPTNKASMVSSLDKLKIYLKAIKNNFF